MPTTNKINETKKGPTAREYLDYISFCDKIWELYKEFNFISITSWGRSKYRNQIKKGHSKSKHLTFTAVDIVRDPGTNDKKLELLRYIKKLGLKYVDEKDHIHIQLP